MVYRQGRDVVIKAIARLSQINPEGLDEYNILKALNSEPMKSDSRNATVTVLDFIEIGPWRFATMPLLDDCAVYPFITALECLDFSCQILDVSIIFRFSSSFRLLTTDEGIGLPS